MRGKTPNGRSTDRGINTPSQKEINHSIGKLLSQMQVSRPHEVVMSRQVMLCVISSKIGYAGLPVDKELATSGTVVDPVETNIYGFGALLFDGIIVKSDGG